MARRLKTAGDVRRALAYVNNKVLDGELDLKIANTFINGCNAILNSIRIDEQDKRIEEIESFLKENTDFNW